VQHRHILKQTLNQHRTKSQVVLDTCFQ
jgi:hypothetical protein